MEITLSSQYVRLPVIGVTAIALLVAAQSIIVPHQYHAATR